MITAIPSAIIAAALGIAAEALMSGLGGIVAATVIGAIMIALIEQKK